MHEEVQKGSLEIICGSMFSGKSEELIRRLKRAELAKQNVLVFKHSLDNRSTIEYVVSHCGSKLKAIPLEKPQDILELTTSNVTVVGIDEVQFFDMSIIQVICDLVNRGKRVLVAGLDLDFRGKPFGCIPTLMAIADNVTKLQAICIHCGKNAHFTQRLVNGKPARHDDPLIVIGAEEQYQARCRSCHQIDEMPQL
ncbi:MAG: thymidine kinase [Candidatus Babeliales bacterium]